MKIKYVRNKSDNYIDFMRKNWKRKYLKDKHWRNSSQRMFWKIAVDKVFDSFGKFVSLIPMA